MWQNEIGFLELFLAYFEQYKNSLAYGKKHRDFLMEILLCHERVIRHCGLVPGLNDYQTDLDGMPVLEPQVIVVEHCDDPENMGSDMVVTKLERLPVNECDDSPALFSLELPFKCAVEEDGQRGLRVDQLRGSLTCKTELPDDDSTQMDARSDADIDADEPPSQEAWATTITPKQEVVEEPEDVGEPAEEPNVASDSKEKLTWFPPTSVSASVDGFHVLASEDECDDFDGPNCQDQPPIYSQVSTATVTPATQRQPLFASIQGHQLDLFRQAAELDEQRSQWQSGERSASGQAELRLPTATDLSRMVNDLRSYVKINTAPKPCPSDDTPPAKRPTLESVIPHTNGMTSYHSQRTTDHPVPPNDELPLRADDWSSRMQSATPSTSPAMDHSISSAPATPSPEPPNDPQALNTTAVSQSASQMQRTPSVPPSASQMQRTPSVPPSASQIQHTPSVHPASQIQHTPPIPPASQIQHTPPIPPASHTQRTPYVPPASQIQRTPSVPLSASQTLHMPAVPPPSQPLQLMQTSAPQSAPTSIAVMRQESAVNEQRPINTGTNPAVSDQQNRRSFICSRCRRLFRSYELFMRHPCITGYVQDPMNGKTGGGTLSLNAGVNIFPNRDVFATKLQHERYQQHIQSIIQQQHLQRLQQQQQQQQRPYLSFPQQQQQQQQQSQPRVVTAAQQQTPLSQQPVPAGRHQIYQQQLHVLQQQQQHGQPHQLTSPQQQQQLQEAPIQQPYRSGDQTHQKQVPIIGHLQQTTTQQPAQPTPPQPPPAPATPATTRTVSNGQGRAQPRQQEDSHQEEERSTSMFRCRMCQRSFFRAGDRMRHERTHASNRRCQWCGKEYSRPSSMRAHEAKCSKKPSESTTGNASSTPHSPPLLVSRTRVA